MMRPLRLRPFEILLAALLGMLGVWSGTAAVEEEPGLSYRLTPRVRGGALELHVSMRFQGDLSGKTRLVLPSHWGGQESLHEGIRELQVEGGRLQPGDDEAHRVILHEPGASLVVSYRAVQDRPAEFSDHGRTHRPILTPDYFHFVGHGLFVYPDLDAMAPRPIRLEWAEIPDAWALANSHGAGEAIQELSIPLDALVHAIYVGGDFRVHRLIVRDRPVVVALRGQWKFSDAKYTSLVADIIRAERNFWKDHEAPYFLVTMIPTGARCCSYGGTSLNRAFATFIATDGGIDMRMKHLLAHELMHTWIGQEIRNADTEEEPESLLYWFSEGFTDYYTRELLLTAGIIDEDAYLEDLNGKIFEYWTSPVRNAPNQRIAGDYWSDRHVRQLPYTRGELLARRWDAEIRRRSGRRFGLDDVLREMLAAARRNGRRTTWQVLEEALARHLGPNASREMEAFVRLGRTVPPVPGRLEESCEVRELAMTPFDLGFDFEASRRGGVATGVRKEGPAWKAGLREGQKLKGFSIHWDDASRPVIIQAEVDGELKRLEYIPQGPPIDVPQIVRRELPSS